MLRIRVLFSVESIIESTRIIFHDNATFFFLSVFDLATITYSKGGKTNDEHGNIFLQDLAVNLSTFYIQISV